jgi:class 3 adenylate cyclase/CheY-like chemotaxis protein
MATILVVEDEAAIRSGLQTFLEFEQYTVFTAENGQQGLELARQHHPDLILSDVMMPVMDGYKLLEALRKDHTTHNVPFIFLTAKDDRESQRKGMIGGADDYLTKPFTFDEVLSTIKARLQRQQTLLTDVARQIDELSLLRRIDQELSYRLSPDWIIEITMDWALRRTGANVALMGVIDQDEPILQLRYIFGQWSDKTPQRGDRWALDGIIGVAARSENPILINDVTVANEHKPVHPEMRSILGVPLATSERRLGVMLLESKKPSAFNVEDVMFLSQVANRAAMALEQSHLFQILLQQQQQETELRELFASFVSQQVAEAARTGEHALVSASQVVTVLFCDIRDFTALSERLAPQEVVEILNDYLPIIVNAANQYGGMVNKFGGDSTLLVFGAPKPLRESAYKAIFAALQIRQQLDVLNQTKFSQRNFTIKIGTGINTGEVVAGTIGPKERQEYTVIGDTVNLSSRIQALNKEYPQHDILISDETHSALGSRQSEFEFADLGSVMIRGKTNATKIWGVVGFAKPTPPVPASTPPLA